MILDACPKVIQTYLVTEADEKMVMGKRRSLKLTFTNLSKSTTINYHRDMFKTGKFFNHPVNAINHGEKMTILVMNTEGLHLAGVSGGMTLELKSGKWIFIVKFSRFFTVK